MTEFAPELQRPWTLQELRLTRCDQVLIRVFSDVNHKFPAAVGRHGSDIVSYPQISTVQCQAEFSFTDCVLIRVWDEFAISTIETSPQDSFDGTTFRRFSKSALLSAHSAMPASVYHYELVCDSIIDIVCTKPPDIILRPCSTTTKA